jgi:hypothetical protein
MSINQKKLEKLASGVYLITSFFVDAEPMKWKLRALSSEAVSLGMLLRDSFQTDNRQISIDLRNIILEILSLLEVAKSAALVSDTNHTLIKDEFIKYLGTLTIPEGLLLDKDGAVLSSSFFNSNLGDVDESYRDIGRIEGVENPQLRDRNPKEYYDLPKKRELLNLDDMADKGHVAKDRVQKSKSLKDFGAVSVKKNSRQSIIINLLKRKKEIMIKDVSPLISGCSEKTIQRELLAMVKAGILRKTGEKRWSRYSLA